MKLLTPEQEVRLRLELTELRSYDTLTEEEQDRRMEIENALLADYKRKQWVVILGGKHKEAA